MSRTWQVIDTEGNDFTVEAADGQIKTVLRDAMLDRFADNGADAVGIDTGACFYGEEFGSAAGGGEGTVVDKDLRVLATFWFRPAPARKNAA